MGKSIKNLSSVTQVGLDLAKNVCQVHAIDAQGAVVVAKPVRRGQLLNFSPRFRPASSALRHAVRHISGRGS